MSALASEGRVRRLKLPAVLDLIIQTTVFGVIVDDLPQQVHVDSFVENVEETLEALVDAAVLGWRRTGALRRQSKGRTAKRLGADGSQPSPFISINSI